MVRSPPSNKVAAGPLSGTPKTRGQVIWSWPQEIPLWRVDPLSLNLPDDPPALGEPLGALYPCQELVRPTCPREQPGHGLTRTGAGPPSSRARSRGLHAGQAVTRRGENRPAASADPLPAVSPGDAPALAAGRRGTAEDPEAASARAGARDHSGRRRNGRFGDSAAQTDGGHGVIESERQEVRAAARDLTAIRYRLLGVQASIPPSAQETSREDLEGDRDVETEMRSVIANRIPNYLEPRICELLR